MLERIKSVLGEKQTIVLAWSLAILIIGTVLHCGVIGTDSFRAVADSSQTATTSVHVVNTPPEFDTGQEPHEDPVSSVASPTNEGTNVTFKGTATDPNNEDWYLAICKTASVTPGTGGAAPTCESGANTWCISTSTISGTEGTCATSTTGLSGEDYNWYAYACDDAAVDTRCTTSSLDIGGDAGSPFVVNHRPTFSSIVTNLTGNPNGSITVTTTADDADDYGGDDTIDLFVCATNSWTSGGGCASTTLCSITASSSNPSCTFDISSTDVKQDGLYHYYGFIMDNHDFEASGGAQGSQANYIVNNVAPTVGAGQIELLDTDGVGNMVLLNESTSTPGFKVSFTVVDSNSCINASGTDEISATIINVYRSSVTQSGCDESGDYNANRCYPDASASWDPVCTASSSSCTGVDDSDVIWECTFPLQFFADPTDGTSASTSPWWDQNWLTSVQATDDGQDNGGSGLSSALTEDSDGNELTSFLAFNLTSVSIPYGSKIPGDKDDPLDKTTTMQATGNVGLDELLQGTDMCRDYPTCALSPQIGSTYQKFTATTSPVAYDDGIALASTTATNLELNCLKTTSATPAEKDTYWGIEVPSTITVAGDYTGLNTFIGVVSEGSEWQ